MAFLADGTASAKRALLVFLLFLVALEDKARGFSFRPSPGDSRCGRSGACASPRSRVRLPATETNDEFWEKQQEIAKEIAETADRTLRQEQLDKFAARRTALLVDTAFFSSVVFSFCWILSDNPFFAVSYLFGSVFGLAYAYGLGKYVETIGGSVDDVGTVQGSGVGQARFAFLILLFVLVGKLRSYGLVEIPSILGFFTYQLASLSQGLREIDD